MIALPAVTGVLLPAVTAVGGVHVGVTFTTTAVVAVAVQVPDDKTVTVYVPAFKLVDEAITGFWVVEVKPFGPDHE